MPTVRIRSKGKITLPAQFRSKYKFQEGDVFTILDLEDGSFLLKPGISKVNEIAARVENSLKEEGVTLDDLLETLRDVRKELFQERYGKFIKGENSN